MSVDEFERLGGHGAHGKWLESCRMQHADGTVGAPMGVWLRRKGASWGQGVVGHRVSVFWPEDRRYYPGTIEAFMPSTGEHQVRGVLALDRSSPWGVKPSTRDSRSAERVNGILESVNGIGRQGDGVFWPVVVGRVLMGG